jgi:hypothetical protein
MSNARARTSALGLVVDDVIAVIDTINCHLVVTKNNADDDSAGSVRDRVRR